VLGKELGQEVSRFTHLPQFDDIAKKILHALNIHFYVLKKLI